MAAICSLQQFRAHSSPADRAAWLSRIKMIVITEQLFKTLLKEMLGEYGSDLQFPRARAPEYSAERERAYLLSSERVQELPRCSGRHIRFQAPESNRFDFPTLDD